jgi:PAS domain S-box-containing protein
MKVILLSVIVALLGGGLRYFLGQQTAQRQSVEENLWTIAKLKSRQISDWREERLSDALVLMDRQALIVSVKRYLSGAADQEAAEIVRRLNPLKQRYDFENILLVDPQKKIRMAMGETEMLEYNGYLDTFDAAVAEHRPVWTPIHMDLVHAAPHMAMVVPLFSEETDKTPVGGLVLISDAAEFLYPLIQSWPTNSETAETLLVQRDGEDVLFLNELRHQEGTALNLRIPLSRADLPAAMAVSGKRGIVEGRDYRGEEVVAAILPVADSPWYMIAKIDSAEAFAEWRFRSVMILVLLSSALGLVVLAWVLVSQSSQKVHYRKLYRSEATLSQARKQHEITLRAIGDGVISTDINGCVEFMNHVAEKLTGWSLASARGKKMSDVFVVVDEETWTPIDDLADTVIRGNQVRTLSAGTLLLSREGLEISVADSVSPIRNENGDPVGLVLVFKDESENRRYQKMILESEEKYRLLADTTLDVIWTTDMDLRFTYVNPAIRNVSGYEQEEWTGSRIWDHCGEETQREVDALLKQEIAKGPDRQGIVFEMEMFKKDGTPVVFEIHLQVMFDASGCPVGLQGTTRDATERHEAEKAYRNLQEQLAEARKMEAIGRLAGGMAHDYNNMLNIITGYSELGQAMVSPEEPLYQNFREILGAAQRSAAITRKLLAFARRQMIKARVLDLNETIQGMLEKMTQALGSPIELVWRPGNALWPVKIDPAQFFQILSILCDNSREAIAGTGEVRLETKNICFDEAFCKAHPGSVPGDFVMVSLTDTGKGIAPEVIGNVFEPFFTTKPFGESAGMGLAVAYGIVKQNNGFFDVESRLGEGTTFRLFLPRQGEEGHEDED